MSELYRIVEAENTEWAWYPIVDANPVPKARTA